MTVLSLGIQRVLVPSINTCFGDFKPVPTPCEYKSIAIELSSSVLKGISIFPPTSSFMSPVIFQ